MVDKYIFFLSEIRVLLCSMQGKQSSIFDYFNKNKTYGVSTGKRTRVIDDDELSLPKEKRTATQGGRPSFTNILGTTVFGSEYIRPPVPQYCLGEQLFSRDSLHWLTTRSFSRLTPIGVYEHQGRDPSCCMLEFDESGMLAVATNSAGRLFLFDIYSSLPTFNQSNKTVSDFIQKHFIQKERVNEESNDQDDIQSDQPAEKEHPSFPKQIIKPNLDLYTGIYFCFNFHLLDSLLINAIQSLQ